MPDPAEILDLVLELDDWDDLRKAFDALDEGIFDHLAEALGERQKLRRRQVLIAEENHVVLKPDLADFADDIVARLTCKVDTQDFRADRTRQTPHFKSVSRHDRRPLLLRCLLNLA